jgi:hypothetical protein
LVERFPEEEDVTSSTLVLGTKLKNLIPRVSSDLEPGLAVLVELG